MDALSTLPAAERQQRRQTSQLLSPVRLALSTNLVPWVLVVHENNICTLDVISCHSGFTHKFYRSIFLKQALIIDMRRRREGRLHLRRLVPHFYTSLIIAFCDILVRFSSYVRMGMLYQGLVHKKLPISKWMCQWCLGQIGM